MTVVATLAVTVIFSASVVAVMIAVLAAVATAVLAVPVIFPALAAMITLSAIVAAVIAAVVAAVAAAIVAAVAAAIAAAIVTAIAAVAAPFAITITIIPIAGDGAGAGCLLAAANVLVAAIVIFRAEPAIGPNCTGRHAQPVFECAANCGLAINDRRGCRCQAAACQKGSNGDAEFRCSADHFNPSPKVN
ncbi:hypothetical protein HFO97_27390 [Rhizobium leguminosarum]|nr:hypothetical protein [Rhizobium leguminosarum]